MFYNHAFKEVGLEGLRGPLVDLKISTFFSFSLFFSLSLILINYLFYSNGSLADVSCLSSFAVFCGRTATSLLFSSCYREPTFPWGALEAQFFLIMVLVSCEGCGLGSLLRVRSSSRKYGVKRLGLVDALVTLQNH